MADKPQPKPTTHKLDALKASDLPQKHHQVGRRVFDRAESRGLAAHFIIRAADGSFIDRSSAAFAALGGNLA